MPQCSRPPPQHSRNNGLVWLSTLSLSTFFSIQLNKSPRRVSKLSGFDDSSEFLQCYEVKTKMISIVWSLWGFAHPFWAPFTSVTPCFTPLNITVSLRRWGMGLGKDGLRFVKAVRGGSPPMNVQLHICAGNVTHLRWSNLKTREKRKRSLLSRLLAIRKKMQWVPWRVSTKNVFDLRIHQNCFDGTTKEGTVICWVMESYLNHQNEDFTKLTGAYSRKDLSPI